MREVRKTSVHDRLASGYLLLQELELERASAGESQIGKAIERRVIQRELLDLELQELDEQIDRICAMSARLHG